jgi:small neutral amino acid transporter SnatA (MarC family)
VRTERRNLTMMRAVSISITALVVLARGDGIWGSQVGLSVGSIELSAGAIVVLLAISVMDSAPADASTCGLSTSKPTANHAW